MFKFQTLPWSHFYFEMEFVMLSVLCTLWNHSKLWMQQAYSVKNFPVFHLFAPGAVTGVRTGWGSRLCGFWVVILPHQVITIQPTAFPGGQRCNTWSPAGGSTYPSSFPSVPSPVCEPLYVYYLAMVNDFVFFSVHRERILNKWVEKNVKYRMLP